eukprot:1783119-Rhodomonas_salina.1
MAVRALEDCSLAHQPAGPGQSQSALRGRLIKSQSNCGFLATCSSCVTCWEYCVPETVSSPASNRLERSNIELLPTLLNT